MVYCWAADRGKSRIGSGAKSPEIFYPWIRRNPLKSPDSDEGISKDFHVLSASEPRADRGLGAFSKLAAVAGLGRPNPAC